MAKVAIQSGDIAYIVPRSGGDNPNRLRVGAGTDQKQIGSIPEGRPVQIIKGPEQTDGHDAQGAFKVNWWYVEAVCSDTVSRQGYTADCDPSDRSKVYLLPYRNCPDDGASLLKTKLSDEAKAKVVSGYVNIRSFPNKNENAIGQKLNGAMFKVYGYPRCDEQGRIWGSPALRVKGDSWLGWRQHTFTEQVEAGTAIHGALDQLESVDLAFHLAVAPGQ